MLQGICVQLRWADLRVATEMLLSIERFARLIGEVSVHHIKIYVIKITKIMGT